MIIKFSQWHLFYFSPLLGLLFPGIAWAGEAPYKPVPSSSGGAIVCPDQSDNQNQVLVCNGGGVYIIVGDEILVPVSPPEVQGVSPNEQFSRPMSDPYLDFPGRDLPAGVNGH